MTLMPTYAPHSVSFTHGEGAWLYDASGKAYLDGLTGIAVCGLGHAHPAVTQAICEQAQKLLHCSNHFRIEQQEALAEKLCALSGMENVFFSNSGAEANEAAIKLARMYGHKVKNVNRPAIVVTEGAFHGRTMATLTATGNRKIQAGFEPLVSGFVRAPFDDLEAIRTIARNNRDVVAVLVEPVQGEGGICIPSDNYLRELQAICDEYGWLLMLDEIQTGNGRTGHYFAYQSAGCTPDVVTTAKGLGNGVPIGCCLARGRAADVLRPGSHGSTFGGNPLACATALAVVDTITEHELAARSTELGQLMAEQLQPLLMDGLATEIRQRGLMIGIELKKSCSELVALGLEQGLILNVTADSVVRLLPPLILSNAEAGQLAEKTVSLIRQFLHSSPSS